MADNEKITKDEFDRRVKELMDLTDDDTRVFVVSYHEKENDTATDIHFAGAGCPACAVNVIFGMAARHAFEHTGFDPTEGLSKDN